MIDSKALFSVLAISVSLSFSSVDLGWAQDQTQDRERLQHEPLQEKDPTKQYLKQNEQLQKQIKEKEMKQERLEKEIRSQGRSQTQNLPPSGGGGKGGGMGGRRR